MSTKYSGIRTLQEPEANVLKFANQISVSCSVSN